MCTENELKAILQRVDRHLSDKEKETERILGEIQDQLVAMQEQQKGCTEMLRAWNNTKGFAKITKYLFYLLIAVGVFITAIKDFPLTFK